jgi:hypothetical protein
VVVPFFDVLAGKADRVGHGGFQHPEAGVGACRCPFYLRQGYYQPGIP